MASCRSRRGRQRRGESRGRDGRQHRCESRRGGGLRQFGNHLGRRRSVNTGSAGLGSGETVLVGNATDHVALTAGLAVTTGDGNDGVFINNLTADHINVNTGTAAANASDTVTIGNLAGLGVTGLVSIAPAGRGFVTLDKLSAGSVDVHPGAGPGSIVILAVAVGSIGLTEANGGNDQSTVNVGSAIAQVSVTGGLNIAVGDTAVVTLDNLLTADSVNLVASGNAGGLNLGVGGAAQPLTSRMP